MWWPPPQQRRWPWASGCWCRTTPPMHSSKAFPTAWSTSEASTPPASLHQAPHSTCCSLPASFQPVAVLPSLLKLRFSFWLCTTSLVKGDSPKDTTASIIAIIALDETAYCCLQEAPLQGSSCRGIARRQCRFGQRCDAPILAEPWLHWAACSTKSWTDNVVYCTGTQRSLAASWSMLWRVSQSP